MDKRKGTNNDLKNTAQKTKDRTKRTQLKTLGEFRCSGSVSSSYSTSGTRSVTLVTNPLISHEWGKDREVLTKLRTNQIKKKDVSDVETSIHIGKYYIIMLLT